LELAGFERAALLDVRLEIADVAARVDLQPRAAGVTGLRQRLAHRRAAHAVARVVDVGFGDLAEKRAAAEEDAEVALLVAERDDIDAGVAGRLVLAQGARGFERVDHAERTVEPAGVILAFDVRAGENLSPGRARKADHIADAIDLGIEAGLG